MVALGKFGDRKLSHVIGGRGRLSLEFFDDEDGTGDWVHSICIDVARLLKVTRTVKLLTQRQCTTGGGLENSESMKPGNARLTGRRPFQPEACPEPAQTLSLARPETSASKVTPLLLPSFWWNL